MFQVKFYLYLSPSIRIVFSFQATGTASWCRSGTCFSCELSMLVMCQLIIKILIYSKEKNFTLTY